MQDSSLFLNLLIASISTFGFAVFMHSPRRTIFQASLTGGLGWMCYVFLAEPVGVVLASFFAACVVGLCGEVFARIFKAPSILFIMPGMIPLVPGRGLYLSIAALIDKKYIDSLSQGATTFAIAGAIAFGIIFITSTIRILSIDNYLNWLFAKKNTT